MNHHAAPLLTALLLATSLPARAAAEPVAAPTGLARFTRHDQVVTARISPKGTYLAVTSQHEGRASLVFIELASRKVCATFNPSGFTTPGAFYWASDDRVVVELLDQDGTLAGPVSRGEIASVMANTGASKLIFGYRAGEMQTGTLIKRGEPDRAWGHVVDPLRHDDRYVLISSRSMDDTGDRQVRLYKLDVVSGLKTQVAVSPAPEADFLTDADGELRMAVSADERNDLHYWLRTPEGGWRELTRLAGFSRLSRPVAFLARAQAIEVVEPHGKGFGLFSVSLETGARTLLAATEIAPPTHFDRDRETREAVSMEWQPDLPATEPLQPAHPIAKVLDGLLAAYPGRHVRLLSRTDDDRLAVALVYGDREPGQLLLVDVAKHSAETVGAVRPWIRPEEMAEVEAFHIAASDGLRIHGYLTLPPAAPGAAPPPLVVLPHGGPHGVRDVWGFDWEAQLLASQGFAVLQVNFRGSGGYGDAYQEAGYRHWGDRVVQDVVDATRWAVRKGKVDGQRVCSLGTSFGAFAAMQVAILAPDLFRCAAGVAGIYDLTLMDWRGDIPDSKLGRGYLKRAIGEDQAAQLAASPAQNAAKLQVPVFLAHGGRDERAPIAHAEKLKDALTALGRPPIWLVESAEGHGFHKEEARERLYGRLVEFLKASTGPRTSAAPAPGAPGGSHSAKP